MKIKIFFFIYVEIDDIWINLERSKVISGKQ